MEASSENFQVHHQKSWHCINLRPLLKIAGVYGFTITPCKNSQTVFKSGAFKTPALNVCNQK